MIPPDEITIEELLKRPSSLPAIGATMRGFPTEAEAREVGNSVLCFLQVFGTYLNLERLGAITLAYDYADALAQVDTGGLPQAPFRTQDDIAVGIAMAVTVLRDGIPKMHMVLNAGYLSALRNPNDPNYGFAVYTLAHEASHVHDLARQDRAYPGVFGQPIRDNRNAVLFSIAQSSWEEYIASLLSASWASPNQTEYFESTFCKVLTGIRERSNAHIRDFRTHTDVNKLIRELVDEYGDALKYGAYLLGHLEGLGEMLPKAAPKADTILQELSWFSPLFEKFSANLRILYEAYGGWSGLEVFDPLKNTIQEVFKAAGIEFQPRPSGVYYLNVPFTPETMP
jgi:hypothetical protein